VTNLSANLLKAWPVFVALCGAVWFLAHGDTSGALGALGLGGSAALSAHVLHMSEPPK
jgi:hypothetical protein